MRFTSRSPIGVDGGRGRSQFVELPPCAYFRILPFRWRSSPDARADKAPGYSDPVDLQLLSPDIC